MRVMLLILLIGFKCFAQLQPFSLEVSATPQTCLGNGMLTFAVSGTNTAASIEYKLYLMPQAQVPVATVTTTTVSGLAAGEYLVVATQTLNGEFNTASATAVIQNEIVPFAYTTQLTDVQCDSDGKIEVVVTSGNAVSYEIISGPQTRPLQVSPVFTGLPQGQYQVRAHNDCGDAYVVTVQLVEIQPYFYISETFFSGNLLNACGTITVGHTYTNNSPMVWPVTFQYTVHPPNGDAPVTVVHDNIWQYNATQSVLTEIPFYNAQQYTYDIQITDGCGNSYTRYDNVVNKEIDLELEVNSANCGEYFVSVEPSTIVLPFTVSFISAPAGFDPEAYNPVHPVSESSTAVYGSQTNPLPYGSYVVQITDACGNINSKSIEIGAQVLPNVETIVNDFCKGTITVQIPIGQIVSGIITAAPATYLSPLPQDVSSSITAGQLVVGQLPVGQYTITVVDGCGFTYEVQAEIIQPAYDSNLYAGVIPGCSANEGSVMLYALDSMLNNVLITAAPQSFPETLPYNASASINVAGTAVLLSLPEGTYTFETTDTCGNIRTKQVTVNGFELYSNNTVVVKNCDSFDVNVQYNGNLDIYDSYWLQKYNEATGIWGHPETGVAYTQPDISIISSSILLYNGQMNYNFNYEGKFRILRVVHYFGIMDTNCADVIYEFSYYQNPAIIAAYSLPCENGLSEVIIDAVGAEPLQYSITSKDGEPYEINNGVSNLFSGLEDAIYNFRVTDACNNLINIEYNPLDLEPLVIAGEGFCNGAVSELSVPQYSFLTYEWWNAAQPGITLSTSNTLQFAEYNPETDSGTYYLRIVSTVPGSCIDAVLEHVVSPAGVANAGQDAMATICNNGQYDLASFLTGSFTEGVWEDVDNSGSLSGNICNAAVLAPGTYHFRYITNVCNAADEAMVTLNVINAPQTPVVIYKGGLCEGSTIQLVAEDIPGAVYQWTGPGNFSSAEQFPVITDAGINAAGTYACVVTVNGCPSVPATININIAEIPQFSLSGNTALCSGADVEVSVIPENFSLNEAFFTWYYNGILLEDVNAATIQAGATGTYEVVVRRGACQMSKSINIEPVTESFEIVLESGCNNNECVISVINLESLPDAAFEWTGPDGFVQTGRTITITGQQVGQYSILVTNAEGCTATAITAIESTACSIPRGISPGDASHNNSFDLSGFGVQNIQIFNRYGLQVYEKSGGYKNEWYGQSDKGELPAGTYYYVLWLASGKRMTGWVYLKREN